MGFHSEKRSGVGPSCFAPAASGALRDELQSKQEKMRLWPLMAIAAAALLGHAISAEWPLCSLALLLLAGAAGTCAVRAHDVLKKTAVLRYQLDPEMEAAYARLHGAASRLAACTATWHIEVLGSGQGGKHRAGAGSLVRRKNAFIGKAQLPYVRTNVDIVALGLGPRTLYFLPDRVLVYDRKGVGTLGYQELSIEVDARRFIEDSAVPGDAEIVASTWTHVDEAGGPDRRFKDNREFPVCLYEEISLLSRCGLNEVLQLSRCGFGAEFSQAVSSLGNRIPRELLNAPLPAR